MTEPKQKYYLRAEDIIAFLLDKGDKLDNFILCRNFSGDLITSDQSLYEAIGSIREKQMINYNKLVKLLEMVEVMPYSQMSGRQRHILTQKRADEINDALKINEVGEVEKKE